MMIWKSLCCNLSPDQESVIKVCKWYGNVDHDVYFENVLDKKYNKK